MMAGRPLCRNLPVLFTLRPCFVIILPRPQARTLFGLTHKKNPSALMSVDKFWKDIGERLKKLDEEVKSVARNVAGDRSLLPRLKDTWPFEAEVFQSLFTVPEIVEGPNKTKYYKVAVPVGKQFVPDNVKVVMKNFHLTVTAKKEDKSNDGLQHFYTEIKREITLPDYIDLEHVKSVMGEDGILRIEAPVLPGIEPPSKAKEIPIKHLK